MKNIAVFIYNIINDYTASVIEGIKSFYADKPDYRLIYATVNVPHAQTSDYDYQYWTLVKILEAQQIDGVIIVPNSFANYIDMETLASNLQGFCNRPVVSVSTPLNLSTNIYTTNTCENAYLQVVQHLKNKHNCSKIAFFAAGLTNSEESSERLEAFAMALEANGLDFNPELVFDGDFTPGTAKEVLASKYKSKEEINFDSIVCVNDHTAGGCILFFNDIGVNVPEEVKIVGFDDSDFALMCFPTLSSISQTIPINGYTAAEMLYITLEGEVAPKKMEISSFPVYRQSCGCVDCTSRSAYYDQHGIFHDFDDKTKQLEYNIIQNYNSAFYDIYNFLNVMDTRTAIEDVVEVLYPSMQIAKMTALMVCFFDEPVYMSYDTPYNLPENVKVQVAVNLETGFLKSYPFGEGQVINLKERIAPEEYDVLGGGTYFIHPIYLHEKNYGYVLCKIKSNQFISESISLKILADILVHSYEYSKQLQEKKLLMENNNELVLQSRTDELTKVLNRRGTYEYGQQLIDLNCSMNKTGTVFFCDLDGLKKMNDTWGHEIGDLAIKTEAEVLKATFRGSDLVGRLSGDEFCVVAPGFDLANIDNLRKTLIINNKIFSEQAGLPFILSISIGGMEFNSQSNNIQELLHAADAQLYEEKHIKHGIK